jgi:hypothetical protein
MRRFLSLTSSVAALALASFLPVLPVSAQTITEFTAGTNATTFIPGQQLTTPGGGPWNNIRFNWFAPDFVTPTASGTLYLLSQEYLGAPANLGTATGLIAASTGIVGGVYQFSSSVTLQPTTPYWFYTDVEVAISGAALLQVPGTTLYAGDSGNFVVLTGQTLNHRLAVAAAAGAPEPGTVALLGAGLGVVGLVMRRKR